MVRRRIKKQQKALGVGERRPPPNRVRFGFRSVSGWLPRRNEDFLAQRYICDKIFIKMRSAFSEIWAKLLEMSYLHRNVEEFFKKFLDPRIRKRMTCKIWSVFPVHSHISGKIFIKIRPVVDTWSCWEIDRQPEREIDRQTLRKTWSPWRRW